MKKNFKKLVLNKSTLSNLENNEIVGGKKAVKQESGDMCTGQSACASHCGDKCWLAK